MLRSLRNWNDIAARETIETAPPAYMRRTLSNVILDEAKYDFTEQMRSCS